MPPILFVLDVPAAVRSDAGWEEAGRQDVPGVGTVRSRHKRVAGVDCLEASTVSAVSADVMWTVILDIHGNLEWSSADLARSDVLARTDGRIDYVQVLDLPAPLSDRYWFLRGTTSVADGTRTLTWDRLDGATSYPEAHRALLSANPDLVEVTVNSGSWALIPDPAGTLVRFRSCTDVGGSIPTWAGEAAAKTMLPNNVEDLVREAVRRGG